MLLRSFRGVRVLRFGEFELFVRAAELRRNGDKVRLQEQPYRLLLMLLEHPGEVVLREEICKRLWPNDTVVEVSHGINAAVLRLREALGESAGEPRYIETLARRGYRFTGEVQAIYREAAPEPEASSLTGRTISHFRIMDRLGGGGMGVVYRAEDLNLGRQVALKFLPPELAADSIALERFQREARTASALNHPNVCTVYSVEDCGGQPAIVMELLEGETLEQVLGRGPLPPGEAKRWGAQIAAALEAAHRKHIVHRDLKPANVILTAAGVKVLDFGLAKNERLISASVTETGALIGTPRYMAPEQLRGGEATPASDIYALGLMLQEMGAGASSIVARCVAADPSARPAAGEVRAALEATAVFSFRPRVSRRSALAVLAVAAGITVVAVIPAVVGLPSRFVIDAPGVSPITRLNLSPDGKRVAFVSGGRIYVRDLASRDSRYVEGTIGAGTPFWSPDGDNLAFTSGNRLMRIPADGGMPQVLCEVDTNVGGAWSPSGEILIGQRGDALYRVASTGGELRRLTEINREKGETRHMLPQFLPGGRRFLYVAGADRRGASVLYAASLDGGERVAIMPVESNVAYADGHLLFLRDRALFAQRFDPASLQRTGEPFRIGGPIATAALVATTIENADFSAAGKTLAFRQTAGQVFPVMPVQRTAADPATRGITVLRNWAR